MILIINKKFRLKTKIRLKSQNMSNITRIKPGPYPTPRPGEADITPSYEEIRVSRLKLAAAAAVVAGAVLVGGIYTAVNSVSKPPTADQIKEEPTDTKPAGYDPDKENPSGIPTSGGAEG